MRAPATSGRRPAFRARWRESRTRAPMPLPVRVATGRPPSGVMPDGEPAGNRTYVRSVADLLRRRRETPDLAGHRTHASTVLRTTDIPVHLLRECVQRRCTGSATLHLRNVESGGDGCRS